MAKLYVLNGAQAGESFELREGNNYVGRSSEDIHIKGPTVSREHLRITVRRGRYYLTDLGSRNRTFLDGNYLAPGLEYEVKEAFPIAIGLAVLCIESDSFEETTSYLSSMGIPWKSGKISRSYSGQNQRSDQKKLEMLFRVSDVLGENLPVRVTCRKILDHILDLLIRIDRGVFVLIDPITKEITETISKPDNIVGNMAMSYLRTIVQRVISDGKPLVVSNVQMEKDELADMLKKLKIESLLCVPMSSKSEILGFLYIDSLRTPYGFRLDDVSLFMDLSQRIVLAIQSARIASDSEEKDNSRNAQRLSLQGKA
jgi:hypothetical protein